MNCSDQRENVDDQVSQTLVFHEAEKVLQEPGCASWSVQSEEAWLENSKDTFPFLKSRFLAAMLIFTWTSAKEKTVFDSFLGLRLLFCP